VRTGLLAVGLALALVGAGVTLSGFLIPTGHSTTEARLNTISAPNIAYEQTRVGLIWMTNTSSGTLAFSWSATHAITVAIYQGVPCSSGAHYCASGAPMVDWPSNSSGAWNRSGGMTFPFLLSMQNVQVTNATLRGTLAESFVIDTPTLPTWAVFTILAGGVLLVAMGGVAVFLGLFLRSGVYSRPESVPPRYAHELDRVDDPLDEPFDEEELDSDEGPPPPH
jgi:hypothetical protein